MPLPGSGGDAPLPGLRGDDGGGAPGKSASLADIFGDTGGGGQESVPNHPFHGEDSTIAPQGGGAPGGGAPGGGAPGGGLLDFIQQGGGQPASPGTAQQMFRVKKRSGQVIGPYDQDTVLAMIQRQELVGNEEASTDGNTWRPLGQISAFKDAIQAAMASALSGLDLPDVKGGTELPGLPDSNLPGLAGEQPSGADGQPAGAAGKPSTPGAAAQLHPSIVRRRRRRRIIRIAAALVVLLVVGAGVALEFATPFGYFGWKKVMELVEGKKPVDKQPDGPPKLPDIPDARVPPSELLSQDTYVAYRQGAELQGKIVAAGKQLEQFPPEAAKAAAEQARFLSYLVAVEGMSIFVPQLQEVLPLASPGSPGRVIGEAALAYAGGRWDDGIAKAQPFTDEDKGLPKNALAEMNLWVGLGHLGAGRFEKAQQSFDAALVQQPDDLAALYHQGETLARAGEREAAVGYLDKALQAAPEHPRALLKKGQMLITDEETRTEGRKILEALSEGKKGKEAAPVQRARAYMGRSELAVGELQWEKALKLMNSAVDVVPQNREVRIRHGELALKLREFGLARQSFKKLVELDPEDSNAVVGLARAKIGSRDFLNGYSDLQAFIEKKQDDPVLHFWFAVAGRELLKMKDARKHFSRARELDPKWAAPAAELILDLIDQGKLKEALELASKAEGEVDSDQRHAIRAAKAAIFIRQRNYKLAEKELEQAIAEDPRDVDARVRYVELQVTLNDLRKAAENAREARMFDPKNPSVIAASGVVEAARGDHQRALELFEEATSLAPNDHRLYLHAAASAIALEDFGRAKSFVDAAGQLQPKNPEVMNYRGQVMRATDPKQAVTVFRDAIELSPEDPRLPYQLGVTFQNMGLNLEAKDAFQKAITLDPSFADAYYGRGVSLRELGRNNEARKAFKEVTRLDKTRADAHIQIAEILASLGDPKGSIRAYEDAQKASPESPKPVCEMGLMLVQSLGNEKKYLARGVKALERCTSLDPKHPEAYRKLGDAYRDLRKKSLAIAAYKKHRTNNPDDPNNEMVCESMKLLGARCQ